MNFSLSMDWNFMWINGEKVSLPETFPVRNPATGETIASVPLGGKAETEKAIAAAYAAFPAWSGLTAQERARYLFAWAEKILVHKEELATILSSEQGKPLEEAKGEIEGAADFIFWYGEEAKRIYGEIIPPSRSRQRILVFRQPVGVAGLITPWNFPAAMVTRKAAPALAAGCTVVLKPAKQTPLIALALFQLLIETGLPKGVANLVTGNSAEIGEALLADRRVRKISFTGSTEVGKALMRGASGQVKRLSLELGGNAPVIVFPDADLDRAVQTIIANKFENCGQVCNGINRIYVHEAIRLPFQERLAEEVRRLKVGFALEPGVQVGPLIDEGALAKVEEYVRDALAKGAQLLAGGSRLTEPPYDKGYFYAPTVLAGVNSEMRIAHEEVFGPVAPVLSFASEEEVLRECNDTPYGLAAYFFTRDLGRAFRVAERLEFGMVAVNGTSLSVPQAPFGGIKESGMGREGGHHGIEEYLEYKYVSLYLEE